MSPYKKRETARAELVRAPFGSLDRPLMLADAIGRCTVGQFVAASIGLVGLLVAVATQL